MVMDNIENVAIYLRKSRGEEGEDVLSKHRQELTEMAEKYNWRYKIYEEGIVSGDSLYTRPKMLELLDDVDNRLFDGVLVMDYDRLSRGSKADQGKIENTLKANNTLIITPNKVYDLEDDSDDTAIEVEGLVARLEYKMIKKRLKSGKKSGAKQGKWTNGKPPFPYEYKKEITINNNGKEIVTGYVVVNEAQRPVYQLMKELYLSGTYGFEPIAHHLNNNGMRTANKGLWSSVTVQRTLQHEFHTGKVIYGKNKWKKDNEGNKKIVGMRDEEEWSVGYGDHEILKTEEEHNAIMEITNRNAKIPKKSRKGTFPISGLIYCKRCGRSMKINPERKKDSNGRNVYIRLLCKR